MHPTLEPVCAIGRACKRSTRVIRDPPSTQISPAHLLAFNEVDCCSWGQSCMKPPSSRRRLPPMHNALHRMECGSCYGISLRMDEQMIFERHHECEWTRLLVCAEETQVAPELPTEVGIVFTGMLTQSRTATIALHKQTRRPPESSNKQDKCNLGQSSIILMLIITSRYMISKASFCGTVGRPRQRFPPPIANFNYSRKRLVDSMDAIRWKCISWPWLDAS